MDYQKEVLEKADRLQKECMLSINETTDNGVTLIKWVGGNTQCFKFIFSFDELGVKDISQKLEDELAEKRKYISMFDKVLSGYTERDVERWYSRHPEVPAVYPLKNTTFERLEDETGVGLYRITESSKDLIDKFTFDMYGWWRLIELFPFLDEKEYLLRVRDFGAAIRRGARHCIVQRWYEQLGIRSN